MFPKLRDKIVFYYSRNANGKKVHAHIAEIQFTHSSSFDIGNFYSKEHSFNTYIIKLFNNTDRSVILNH